MTLWFEKPNLPSETSTVWQKRSLGKALSIVVSLTWLSCFAASCDTFTYDRPAASNEKLGVVVDHTKITDGCDSCHEADRPEPVDDIVHGGGEDCAGCHRYDEKEKWMALTSFDHDDSVKECNHCHESVRPELPHVALLDCVKCHAHPDWKVIAFDHDPAPSECLECHEKDRPIESHTQGGDCIYCHTSDDWKTTHEYDHDPLPSSCKTCHEADRPEDPHDESGECAGCHLHPDWTRATNLNHLPAPSKCATCHEGDRPPPPHDAEQDCKTCHAFPYFGKLIEASE